MIYHQRNRKKFGTFKKIIIAIIIFLAYVLFSLFFKNSASELSHSVSVPFWKLWNFTQLTVSNNFSFLTFKSNLVKENIDLKNKIDELEKSIVSISFEKSFKEEGFYVERIENVVSAVILKSPPQSPYDTVILSKGKNNGVQSGFFVLGGENVILGLVKKVLDNTSEAVFFSSADVSIDALILRNGIPVEIIGRGGGSFEITIPKVADIVEGDLVIEKNGNYVIAIIEKIESNETSSFNTIFARAPVNIFTLLLVHIIPPRYDI